MGKGSGKGLMCAGPLSARRDAKLKGGFASRCSSPALPPRSGMPRSPGRGGSCGWRSASAATGRGDGQGAYGLRAAIRVWMAGGSGGEVVMEVNPTSVSQVVTVSAAWARPSGK